MTTEGLKLYGTENGYVDFPGRYAVTLFLDGCNMNCPFCFNREMIPGDKATLPWEDVRAYIDRLKDTGLNPAIVLSGGEPTVSPHFADLCVELNRAGFDMGLHTNGIRIPNYVRSFEMPFKSVVLSLKPSELVPTGINYPLQLALGLVLYREAHHKELRVVDIREYRDDYKRTLSRVEPIARELGWHIKWVEAAGQQALVA